tara:strand:+ start:307 stop:897 length:591 start_codon:yes stop_codon:yes gene_type:complete
MKGAPISYSAPELCWLSDNRKLPITEYHEKFCQAFNRDDVSKTNLHSLRKRKQWKTGRTGRFEKGNIPHPDARMKGPNKTSFKKGSRPHNWKVVGSTRVSKDGYVEVKISEPKTWVQLHTIIWSAEHGDIPESHCVVFIDGDKSNVKLENLELITRAEHLQINKLLGAHSLPEARECLRTMGKINAKCGDIKRKVA